MCLELMNFREQKVRRGVLRYEEYIHAGKGYVHELLTSGLVCTFRGIPYLISEFQQNHQCIYYLKKIIFPIRIPLVHLINI